MQRMRRNKKRIWQALAALLTFIIIDRFVAPRHVPWKSLDVDAPIGFATGTKLTLISIAPSHVCLDKLASAEHLSYVYSAPKNNGKCGWKVAATMREAAKVKFRPSTVTAQCPLMLASYIWLGAVDKAAHSILGSHLKTVHHAGTYSCRRQRGNSSGEWSEHAFANAWDITGFELNDGRLFRC